LITVHITIIRVTTFEESKTNNKSNKNNILRLKVTALNRHIVQ